MVLFSCSKNALKIKATVQRSCRDRVKVVKRLLTKAAEKGEDPYLAMLAYRDANLDKGKSPAELLMGRKLRTRLPSVKYRQEKLQREQQEGMTEENCSEQGWTKQGECYVVNS